MVQRTKLFVIVLVLLCTTLLFAKDAVNFSGTWVLDKEKTQLGESNIYLAKIKISQQGDSLATTRTYSNQYGEEYPFDENLRLGGNQLEHWIYDMPRKAAAKWGEDKKSIAFESTTTFSGNSGDFDFVAKETWSLQDKGKVLVIDYTGTTPQGERTGKMFFNKVDQKAD